MQYSQETVEPIGITILYQLDEAGYFDSKSLRERLDQVKDDLDIISKAALRNTRISYVSCSIAFKKADLDIGIYEDYRDDPSLLRLMLGGLDLTDPEKRKERIDLLQKNYLLALDSVPELLSDREQLIGIEIVVQGCRDVVRTQL